MSPEIQKQNKLRSSYKNFLYAVWDRLPLPKDLRSYRTFKTIDGKDYNEIKAYVAMKLHEFVFLSHADCLRFDTETEDDVTIRIPTIAGIVNFPIVNSSLIVYRGGVR